MTGTPQRCAGLVLVWLASLGPVAGCAGGPPRARLDGADRAARLKGDRAAFRIYRDGLHSVVDFAAARPDLVPAERPAGGRLLGREDHEAVRRTWQRFLDYLLALDAIGRYYHSRGIVSPSRRGSWPSSRPRGLRRAVPIRPRLPGPAGPRSGVRRAARPLLHPDTVPNSLPGGIPAEAFEASDVSRALRVAGEVIRVVKGKRSKGGL